MIGKDRAPILSRNTEVLDPGRADERGACLGNRTRRPARGPFHPGLRGVARRPPERILARASDAPLRDGQQPRAPQERPQHLRRLDRRHRSGKALDPPGQLHLPERHHGRRFAEALSQKAAEGVRVRVLTTGSAARTCLAPSGGSSETRAWRYGLSTRPRRCAARVDPPRPPKADRGRRRVRLDRRGVHLRRLACHLPRDRPALPRHGRKRARAGGGRRGAHLRRGVG